MDKFLTMLKNFIDVIANFLKDLFKWKETDFDKASEGLSEYLSEKEAEKK